MFVDCQYFAWENETWIFIDFIRSIVTTQKICLLFAEIASSVLPRGLFKNDARTGLGFA